MKKKSTIKKERVPRKDFAEKLADKLRALNIGEVEEGSLSDDSGRWVNVRFKDMELCFSFDDKGENIDRLGLYKDVIEVTSHRLVWGK
jgi:hypothetical protein